jgi:hypothetical protein
VPLITVLLTKEVIIATHENLARSSLTPTTDVDIVKAKVSSCPYDKLILSLSPSLTTHFLIKIMRVPYLHKLSSSAAVRFQAFFSLLQPSFGQTRLLLGAPGCPGVFELGVAFESARTSSPIKRRTVRTRGFYSHHFPCIICIICNM